METLNTVVLATGNAGKLAEMSAILSPLGFDVRSQTDFFIEEAEETGLTFIENALLKARFASQKTGLPALADDSGLEVKALKGRPGIYSARYGDGFLGQKASDTVNNQKLLAELEGKPVSERKACYYCAMVWVNHADDPTPKIGLGRWCGQVLTAPQGDSGFGYDPLMFFPDIGQTAAELPKEKKNRLSHRAQALKALLDQLKES